MFSGGRERCIGKKWFNYPGDLNELNCRDQAEEEDVEHAEDDIIAKDDYGAHDSMSNE